MQCTCIEIPDLRLQMFLRSQTRRDAHPVAIVEADRPSARVLELNDAARSAGLRLGMPYTFAQSLLPELHAHVIPDDLIAEGLKHIRLRLYAFTPGVEMWKTQAGVFWLDSRGMTRVWGSAEKWARAVHAALAASGYRARMCIGFSRFGTYVIARSMADQHGIQVVHSNSEEYEYMARTDCDCLPISPRSKTRLRKLGITKIREFLAIPSSDVSVKIGKDAFDLHVIAREERNVPVQNYTPEDPLQTRVQLPSLRTCEQIRIHIREPIETLFGSVRNRGLLVRCLTLHLGDENDAVTRTDIIPAEPSCDARLFETLLRIRLESLSFAARMNTAVVSLQVIPADARTFALFPDASVSYEQRNSALALIRADLGNAAVQRIELCDAHIPEDRFRLRSLHEADWGHTCAPGLDRRPDAGPVRRIYTEPRKSGRTELFRNARVLSGPLRYAPRWWTADTQDCSGVPGRTYYILGRNGLPYHWCFTDGTYWWIHGLVQ